MIEICITLTEEQQALRKAVYDLCQLYPGSYWRELDEKREYPEAFVQELTKAGYLAASQDAPSWCYQAGSPCRNVTCVNKLFKTCATVRCFEEVDTAGLSSLVIGHLRGIKASTRH